jgi:ATP-binding cassette subfamily C exporter for protease/lipase
LLLGVWPALAGKVRLDGADIALWPRESLGPSLGYVPQSIELMEGTVWDNLTRFDGSDLSTLNQVLQALPTGWLDFVQDLPQGWLTQVGRGGEALSTGQSQRLIIARALYGQPTLVIMDEPNSALDDAADRQLGELVLAHKARGCTFVVMTHRMSLVNLADKVLWLERGLQKQFGSKDAVIGQMRAGASS